MSRTLPRLAALLLTVGSVAHVAAAPAAAEELVGSATALALVASDTPSTLLPLFPTAIRTAASAEAASTIAPDFSRIRRPRLLPALYAVTVLTQVLAGRTRHRRCPQGPHGRGQLRGLALLRLWAPQVER